LPELVGLKLTINKRVIHFFDVATLKCVMAYLHFRKNKGRNVTGTVQVVEKQKGLSREISSFGTPAELDALSKLGLKAN